MNSVRMICRLAHPLSHSLSITWNLTQPPKHRSAISTKSPMILISSQAKSTMLSLKDHKTQTTNITPWCSAHDTRSRETDDVQNITPSLTNDYVKMAEAGDALADTAESRCRCLNVLSTQKRQDWRLDTGEIQARGDTGNEIRGDVPSESHAINRNRSTPVLSHHPRIILLQLPLISFPNLTCWILLILLLPKLRRSGMTIRRFLRKMNSKVSK